MAKFVEMDDRVKFKDQIEEKIMGSVILINKFNVKPNKVEQFLKGWAEDAIQFKQEPGFISTQLHRGLEKVVFSLTMKFGSQWNIIRKRLIKILFSIQSLSPLLKYGDKSLVISPHLFTKVAVPGICVD